MGTAGWAACCAVAAVLLVSGTAKLLDRAGTRRAVADLGIPAGLGRWVAGALPVAELATGLLLLLPAGRVAGPLVAATLLLVITSVVVVALRAGRRPSCRCFGRLGGAELGSRTVVRNLVLVALAVAGLLAAPAGARPDGPAALGAAAVGLVVAAAVVAAEVLAGRGSEEGLTTPEPVVVPPFEAPTLDGGRVSRDQLLAPGHPVLLVALSPGCGPCKRLRPDVVTWARIFRSRLTVVALATGTAADNAPYYDGADGVVVVADEDLRAALGATSTPSAVLVGADGQRVAVADGERAVRRLLVATLTGVEPDPSTAADTDDSSADGTDPADLGPASVVAPAADVQRHELDGAVVLLRPSTGATVALDERGAVVWSVLDGVSRLDDIAADIAEVYGAPVDAVRDDVVALVRELGRSGLLAGVGAAGRRTTAGASTGQAV